MPALSGGAPLRPVAVFGYLTKRRHARDVGSVAQTEKILVAMSGGVDSSVAALVLKQQGCAVAGAYMKNWINEDQVIGRCPWEEDIADARRVAEQIGIEFQVVNLMQDYRERVVQYLLDGYARGLTPNPDVMCNREIKFGVFRAWAQEHGYAAVATGHYARRVESGRRTTDGEIETIQNPKSQIENFELWEGADKNKDQTYFLARLNQEQLRDARFPIGHLTKPELRRLAREAGLVNAAKKDSQGICFIGQVKMQDFLRAYVPDRPGPIVRATDGAELGRHRGLHYYTIGQRKGIGIPSNSDFHAYVVVGKRAADNALLVAFDGPAAPGLWGREIRVHSLSWIGAPVAERRTLEGRVRYRDPRVALEFEPEGGGSAFIRFAQPQRALASGQILALYDGEKLLGGAVYA
jgi:tRNA-specific 2-thiouridylase